MLDNVPETTVSRRSRVLVRHFAAPIDDCSSYCYVASHTSLLVRLCTHGDLLSPLRLVVAILP